MRRMFAGFVAGLLLLTASVPAWADKVVFPAGRVEVQTPDDWSVETGKGQISLLSPDKNTIVNMYAVKGDTPEEGIGNFIKAAKTGGITIPPPTDTKPVKVNGLEGVRFRSNIQTTQGPSVVDIVLFKTRDSRCVSTMLVVRPGASDKGAGALSVLKSIKLSSR